MGGSHPAYEFTAALLKAKKSVVTSNKEVVASYGDELLEIARENGVSYRFEASVGGGIPLIAPIINSVRHNKIREVRGILNGTTNYILTKMFDYGESFDSALANAQRHGYAEKNPDADIFGTDAARKIIILAALVTGKLVPLDEIHTEGITFIRDEDVKAAGKLGLSIKLVARCILTDDKPYIFVAPFMVGDASPLSDVSGVYNAVEVIAEPLGNVMFYGRGAGSGATASAVVSDIVQAALGRGLVPEFKKCNMIEDFQSFASRKYIALDCDKNTVSKILGGLDFIDSEETAFITDVQTEKESDALLSLIRESGVTVKSVIRLL
jgi:homoserine dehydrogenase